MKMIRCDTCGADNAEPVQLQYVDIKESRIQRLSTHDLCDKCVQGVKRLMSKNYGKTFNSEPPEQKEKV